jgi:purine-binding chemotaxis protein CheW
VAGVGKLNAGQRLVYLLDPASLCDAAELGRLGAGAEAAQQVGEAQTAGGTVQVVVFRLAGGEFAAPIEQVQEIIRPGAITRVPRAPDWVEGVINLRGSLVPVVDLRRRLGLPTEVGGELTRIIVTDSQGSRTGLVVDGVREVLKVPEAAVEEVPEMLVREVDTTGVAGVVNLDRRLILVLDFAALLSAEERAALASLEQMAPDHLGGEAEDLATVQGGEAGGFTTDHGGEGEELVADQGFDR